MENFEGQGFVSLQSTFCPLATGSDQLHFSVPPCLRGRFCYSPEEDTACPTFNFSALPAP